MTKIISAALGLQALREAGYRTTASSVAELVDNSIEAEAANIEIIATNEQVFVEQRQSTQISSIAVFDDGEGMSPEVIQNCLSLGWGTRLDRYEGLGRFGFGLKGASISQARRVDVFSWQKQGDVHHSYLDLDEVEENDLSELPEVSKKNLPRALETYLQRIGASQEHGTVVCWSKLDKIDLKRASTLFRRMNAELCRIYRHYLDDDDTYGKRVFIRLHSIDERGKSEDKPIPLKSNDPLYLLTPNNTPDYNSQQTNELLQAYDLPFESPIGSSTVHIRYSVALPEIQELGGNSNVGKHYGKNTGISLLRAGREIQLGSFGFIEQSEPRHRWWGMEIRFLPALDDVFGITNNKQEVRALRRFDEADIEAFQDVRASADAVQQAQIEFQLKLNDHIKQHIEGCMSIIKGRREGIKKSKKKKIVELVNNDVSRDPTETVSGEVSGSTTEEDKIRNRAELLLNNDSGLSEEAAKSLAKETVSYRIDLQTAEWPGDLFLDNKLVANATVGIINRKHTFYEKLWRLLEEMGDQRGFEALEIVLMAYCRAEDEMGREIDRDQLEILRNKWGSWLHKLLPHAGS